MLQNPDISDIFRIFCLELRLDYKLLPRIELFLRSQPISILLALPSLRISFLLNNFRPFYLIDLVQPISQGLNHFLISFILVCFFFLRHHLLRHLKLTMLLVYLRSGRLHVLNLIDIHLIIFMIGDQ
jgi:hypothetical protein